MRSVVLVVIFAVTAAAQTVPVAPVWQMQDSGTTAGLRGIDSVDGTDGMVAWASGTGGTVLRTTDGGQHWSRCATPDADKDGATLDFRGVQAWDAETAIVMASGPGEKSRLYKTTDECRTWKLVFANPDTPEGFFDSLSLMREQRTLKDHEGFGLLLGDSVRGELSVFETRDGGYTWTKIHDPVLKTDSGAFAASNECIARMNATNDFVVSGRQGSSMLRLNYAGTYWLNNGLSLFRTWYRFPIPFAKSNENSGAFAISTRVQIDYGKSKNVTAALKLHQVTVGGDYTKPNYSIGTAAYSPGGGHWTISVIPPHGYRSAVQYSPSLKAWITAGTNGSDISRDDGRSWQPLDNGNWNALSLPFVVGPQGRIARLNSAAVPGAR